MNAVIYCTKCQEFKDMEIEGLLIEDTLVSPKAFAARYPNQDNSYPFAESQGPTFAVKSHCPDCKTPQSHLAGRDTIIRDKTRERYTNFFGTLLPAIQQGLIPIEGIYHIPESNSYFVGSRLIEPPTQQPHSPKED